MLDMGLDGASQIRLLIAASLLDFLLDEKSKACLQNRREVEKALEVESIDVSMEFE